MELWIRSQDKKKLHNIKHLELNNNETGIFNADTYTLLGKYNSKERALEVLDEIQDLLKTKVIVTDDKQQMINSNGVIYSIDIIKNINTDIQELSTYVYEMPKE